MYTAIKKYCENERQNGLFLMDMPTGFGKTYNVIKYIFDASTAQENKNRRYFFITTLKKNLPTKELEQWFSKAGKAEQFKEKFLFIDSNVDCVIERLTEEVKKEIPYDIRKTDEYKEFSKNVEFLQSADDQLKKFAGSISDNLRIKTEPAFRKMLQTRLAKEYTTVEKRIYAIKTDKNWQWLGKLYPSVFTRDRQIIFMSVDKFLSRNATIVEPSYMFYNSDIIDNAIIFIDEFDATKETLLKNVIQNGLRDKIDYVELFSSIYSSLQTNAFPADLTTPSQKRKNGEYADQSLQGIIDGIREKADAIYKDFSLQFSHKTIERAEESAHNFLFQDHQFHSVLDGNKSFITSKCDRKKKINAITFSKEKPANETNNIQVLLGKLRGFISWFQGGINILAINYMQRKQESRKSGDDEFTFEASVRSVLDLFHLNKDYIDYLTSQIMISSHKVKGNIASSDFDRSFYENGFRFYDFEDDSAHDMQSKIMMCSFQTTPEKILLRFCEKAKVIGISATATIETVVGNYDLDYLKVKMQGAYSEISQSDYHRLEKEFNESQAGYSNITIYAELLGEQSDNDYSVNSWMKVYSNPEIAERIYNKVGQKSTDNKNYNQQRYLRIALAYKKFITTQDIKSFLCVLTKHPKKNDSSLDLEILYDIFGFIGAENLPGFDTKNSVVLLDGDEYESKKNSATARLENGEKLFVISVYQTIGAGQNLQYKAPDEIRESLVRINERSSEEKDYDAIYLDKPTNLLVNFMNNQAVEEEDFVKSIFQYEFLQEWGELSADEATKHIKNAFKHFTGGGTAKKDYVKNVHDSRSIRMLSTRYIIQAIGRICRTNLKNRNIYIFADNRITDCIDVSVEEGRLLNREFLALIDEVKRNGYKSPEEISIENEANLTSSRANKYIRNMLEEEWTDKRIENWQTLRNLVLKQPTMSAADAKDNFVAWNHYIRQPHKRNIYYYSQQEDFNNIRVSFSYDSEHANTVSADGTNLLRLMEFQPIREMFEQRGYATNFEPNDYIMSPTLWNNIYKGALGEVVGQFLFERYLKVKLSEITEPEYFELFDFRINRSLYVDFKNWQESTDFDREKQIEKIMAKAERCGCKCVIIANILTEQDNYRISTVNRSDVEIVIIPSLLIEKPNKSLNEEAWNKIKECIDRYADKDQ